MTKTTAVAIVLSATLLAACGSSPEAQPTASAPSAPAAPAAASAPAAPAAPAAAEETTINLDVTGMT